MKIAIGELIDFFGDEMANRIVNQAVGNKIGQVAVKNEESKDPSASVSGFTVDGQVGQA